MTEAFWEGFEKQAGVMSMARGAIARAKPLAQSALTKGKALASTAKQQVMKTPGRALAAGGAGGLAAGVALGRGTSPSPTPAGY